MRRIEIAKILRNESDFLAKYFLSKLSEISNFNRWVVVFPAITSSQPNYSYGCFVVGVVVVVGL